MCACIVHVINREAKGATYVAIIASVVACSLLHNAFRRLYLPCCGLFSANIHLSLAVLICCPIAMVKAEQNYAQYESEII